MLAIGEKRMVRAHHRALCEVVRSILVGSARPAALRAFAARAIRRGLPIDPHMLFATERVLEAETRYLGLALPALRALHGDCRGWLAQRLRKPEERIEGSIPWNLALGA
jgi:hypothetical protein